jgi:hypothetical protein
MCASPKERNHRGVSATRASAMTPLYLTKVPQPEWTVAAWSKGSNGIAPGRAL